MYTRDRSNNPNDESGHDDDLYVIRLINGKGLKSKNEELFSSFVLPTRAQPFDKVTRSSWT